MDNGRHLVLQAAGAYFAAAARYCSAAKRGEDMETPTQELVGRGIFYHQALKEALKKGAGAAFARRLEHLRRHTELASQQYAQHRLAARRRA